MKIKLFKTIKSKTIAMVFLSVFFTVVMLLIVSVVSIHNLNERDSNQLLEHIGRESASNINKTLESVEHSVDNVYYYAYDQIEALFGKLFSKSFREEYLEKVRALALSEANGLDSVETMYYRLTDDIKEEPKGFLYQKNKETKEFDELALTEPSLYEPDDVGHVGWYYMPKEAKEPIWIGPYQNENLNMRIISYVTPVYIYGRFAGVIGMDIDINVFCKDLEDITVYNTGSAVLFDIEENLLYYKDRSDGLMKTDFTKEEDELAAAMRMALESEHPVQYSTTDGEMKLYACKLVNGMTLCITAPLGEINSTQRTIVTNSIILSVAIFIVTLFIAVIVTNRFLKPLKELTAASKQLEDGKFDVHIHYNGDDEIGQLAKTFELMSSSLKRYFDHFHSLAYTDSLTGLNNKAAFTITKDVVESEVKMGRASFTVIIMDVNNLKTINDSLGHDKGDLLLKHITICLRETFVGYPLYRIGGDEFCAIINDSNPHELIVQLQSITEKMSRQDMEIFNCPYQIAAGAAVYEKGKDTSFDDVFNRADQAMYENKKMLKAKMGMKDSK